MFHTLIANPFVFARFSISSVGSDPIDKMHIRGVISSDSFHVFSRSRILLSANSGPSVSV